MTYNSPNAGAYEQPKEVTTADVERTALWCSLDIIAHELAHGRPASQESIQTIIKAAEWIREHGKG